MIDKWLVWGNVPAGTVVPDGFRERKAPEEPGLYALYELVNLDTHTHMGFVWERQDDRLTNIFNVEDWGRRSKDVDAD